MTQSYDKVCLEHPIKQIKEKIRFLNIIHDTLEVNTLKDSNDYISVVREELEQYEIALEILREHSKRDTLD